MTLFFDFEDMGRFGFPFFILGETGILARMREKRRRFSDMTSSASPELRGSEASIDDVSLDSVIPRVGDVSGRVDS